MTAVELQEPKLELFSPRKLKAILHITLIFLNAIANLIT